jgi:hypothetical protein
LLTFWVVSCHIAQQHQGSIDFPAGDFERFDDSFRVFPAIKT